MGNIQTRFSRSLSIKQKTSKPSTRNPTYKNVMPAYRTSKFTEHFDGPIMHLDEAIIEACPLAFHPKQGEGSKQTQSHPLTPILETGSPPNPGLEPSDLRPSTPPPQPAQVPIPELDSTPISRPPSRVAALSPSSLYSRGTDDSKPFPSTPDSSFLKQEPAHFIYHTDLGETCDSRLLFENTIVPQPLLVAALAVLTGEVSLDGIRQIDEYRFDLPRFSDYINKLDVEKRGDEWYSSQKVFEKCENAVMANMTDETYEQILASGYSSPARVNTSVRGSPGLVRGQGVMSMDEIVEKERGRSLTRREVTGANAIEDCKK